MLRSENSRDHRNMNRAGAVGCLVVGARYR